MLLFINCTSIKLIKKIIWEDEASMEFQHKSVWFWTFYYRPPKARMGIASPWGAACYLLTQDGIRSKREFGGAGLWGEGRRAFGQLREYSGKVFPTSQLWRALWMCPLILMSPSIPFLLQGWIKQFESQKLKSLSDWIPWGSLLKISIPWPHSQSTKTDPQKWGLGICILKKLPGDSDSLGTTLMPRFLPAQLHFLQRCIASKIVSISQLIAVTFEPGEFSMTNF